MKRIWIWILALALAATPALAEQQTALEAFESLLAPQDESAGQTTAEDWLARVVSGEFAAMPEGDGAAAFAEALEPLSRITNRDLAAYASGHGMKMAQVRNAYFKALANALRAEIAVHPEAGEKYRDAQTILTLFLEGGDEGEKARIRERMTPETGRAIADAYGLPEQFVNFVIMDADWGDDSWENDGEWMRKTGWVGAAFDEIQVGTRDSDGSTLIADMQATLISLGYLKGKADGVFGPRTQRALLEFQAANALPTTGAYTAQVHDALGRADAVARWEYGEDLWDSELPDSPDTPERTDTPETPDTPERRDTPETPDTPERTDTPDTPERRDTPDTLDSDG